MPKTGKDATLGLVQRLILWILEGLKDGHKSLSDIRSYLRIKYRISPRDETIKRSIQYLKEKGIIREEKVYSRRGLISQYYLANDWERRLVSSISFELTETLGIRTESFSKVLSYYKAVYRGVKVVSPTGELKDFNVLDLMASITEAWVRGTSINPTNLERMLRTIDSVFIKLLELTRIKGRAVGSNEIARRVYELLRDEDEIVAGVYHSLAFPKYVLIGNKKLELSFRTLTKLVEQWLIGYTVPRTILNKMVRELMERCKSSGKSVFKEQELKLLLYDIVWELTGITVEELRETWRVRAVVYSSVDVLRRFNDIERFTKEYIYCLLYTSPSPRDRG
mgnify:CR=1 FL=1